MKQFVLKWLLKLSLSALDAERNSRRHPISPVVKLFLYLVRHLLRLLDVIHGWWYKKVLKWDVSAKTTSITVSDRIPDLVGEVVLVGNNPVKVVDQTGYTLTVVQYNYTKLRRFTMSDWLKSVFPGWKSVGFFLLALVIWVANQFGFAGFEMSLEQLELFNGVTILLGLLLRLITVGPVGGKSEN